MIHRTDPLLADNYAPITSTVAFFEAPIDALHEELTTWRASLGDETVTCRLTGRLSECLRALEPLAIGGVTRELFLRTDSHWAAYLNNSWQGTDPDSPLHVLCQSLNCRGLSASFVPNTVTSRNQANGGPYGIVSFTLYGPKPNPVLNEVRAVEAANDGGRWTFVNFGQPLPFETQECYSKRRIQDRFTLQMLNDYCQALGIRYLDDAFYGDGGYLIRNLTQERYAKGFVSLDEARAAIGLPHAPHST